MKKTPLFVLALFASCATQATNSRVVPTDAELQAADCGLKPVFHRSMAKLVFDSALKDPESARITYHELQKGWVFEGADDPGAFCWKMPVSVNAKNSFGGYTGAQTWVFWFNNTQLLGVRDGSGKMVYNMPANERADRKAAAPAK